MAQSSEIKLNKRFDQNIEITGTLTVGGSEIDFSSFLTSVPSEYLTQTEGDTRYLKLSGGILTGYLNLQNQDLIFQGSDPGDIVWKDGSGIETHRIWAGASDGLTYRNNSGTAHKLIHAGNISSQSVSFASNAGSIDGIDSSRIIYGNNTSGTNEGNYSDWNALSKTGFYSHSGASNRWSSASDWSSVLHFKLYDNNNNYASQLGFNTYDNRIYARTNSGGAWTGWDEIVTSSNIGSYALTSIPSHTHSGSDITTGTISGSRLEWYDNDGFNGTYPIVWTSSNGLYRSTWFQIRGSDDTVLTRSITADGTVTSNRFVSLNSASDIPDIISGIPFIRRHDASGDYLSSIDNLETFVLSKTDGSYGGGTKPSGSHNGVGIISMQTHTDNYFSQIALDTNQNSLWIRSANGTTSFGGWNRIYSDSYRPYADNAGTLDGIDSSQFLRSDVDDTFSGNLTVSQNITTPYDITVGDQIIHYGDTNTYMQFHAADQWRVVTGGAERLEVNNTQTTINQPLVVNGSYALTYDKIASLDGENVYTITEQTTVEEFLDQIPGTTGAGSISKVSDPDAPAEGCFQINGRFFSDISSSRTYKVDQNSEYTFEMWVKYVSGSDTDQRIYAGWGMFDANLNYFGNTQRYWGSSGTQVDSNSANSGWYKITGTIAGVGGSTGQFINGTKYVRPVFLFNYADNANVIRICGIKLYRSEKKATELVLPRKSYTYFNSESGEAANQAGYCRLQNSGGDILRIQSDTGYVDIGSDNGSYGHILTDRSSFYFNKGLNVDTGLITSYDEDLDLQREGVSKITAGVNNIYVKEGIRINENWNQGDYGAEQLTIIGSYPSIALRNNSQSHKWLIHHDGGSGLQFYEGGTWNNNSWSRRVGFDSGSGGIEAYAFRDIDDTGYYIEPANSGQSARLRGYLYLGPNSQGQYLRLGGDGGNDSYGTVSVSNGNLHIDAKDGNHLYLNHYGDGIIYMNNGGGYAYSYTSMRAPIFYDTNDTNYYINPASTSYVNYINSLNGYLCNSEKGMVGNYDSAGTADKIIWTIGNSWNSLSNHYGIGYDYNSATYGHHLVFRNNGAAYSRIAFAGNGAYFSGTVTASGDVVAYSDERIKENVETIDNALDKVKALRGVRYNKIGEEEKNIGVIAQEIEKVLPEVVREHKQDGMKTVAYGNIVGVLIEAVKELSNKVEYLENQLKQKS